MKRNTQAMLSCLVAGILSAPLHAGAASNNWKGVVITSGISMIASGVPLSRCHVLTNEHVVRKRSYVNISYEGKSYQAKVVSIDHKNDLALVKIPTCPIMNFARVSNVKPKAGDKLTSVYYKPGLNFFNRMIKTTGEFLGYKNIVTEERKRMSSMLIADETPRVHASGGGVSSKNGLVSVIFGISDYNKRHATFAVHYDALKAFLKKNHI